MKKKKIVYLSIAAVAVILAAVLIFQFVFHTNIPIHAAIDNDKYTSSSDENWSILKDGTAVIENDGYRLELDVATTHFTVTDKTNGNKFTSINEAAISGLTGDNLNEYSSELIIGYYDAASIKSNVESFLNSNANSVGFELSEVKTDGNAIRVYYTLRRTQTKTFVPKAFTQEKLENELAPKLSSAYRNGLMGFYQLYKSEDTDKDTAAMKEEYTALNSQNMYILRYEPDEAGENTLAMLLAKCEYTEEEYLADAEELGFDAGEAGKTVGFIIPIEYTLNNDGFEAEILSDKIVSESKYYSLVHMTLLPNFGSYESKSEGYVLVPDGSGAIIQASDKSGSNFQRAVYGHNDTIKGDRSQQLAQNVVMPVFGMNRVNDGFFGIIEGAAEEATIHADICGGVNPSTRAYAEFNNHTSDTTGIGASSGVATISLFSPEAVKEHPKVRYILLGKSNNTYSDMSAVYRNYLIDEGVLTERLTASENIPFYLDFTGTFTSDDSFLGVAYKRENVISTLSGISTAVDKLGELGVDNINVRLKALGNGGLFQGLADDFYMSSGVGSAEDIRNLKDKVAANNGILYIDDNIGVVYDSPAFGRFMKQKHASRRIDKLTASSGSFNLVSRDTDRLTYRHYLLSPMYFGTMAEEFAEGFVDTVGTGEGYGYSWSGYGSRLWADYSESHQCDRSITRDLSTEAFKKAKETFTAGAITDGGFIYAVKEASAVLNVPVSDSLYDSVSYKVPFYQMVLHGYIDYAGAPLNIAADSSLNKLNSIESGAIAYYSCYTEDNTVIKNVYDRSYQYPTRIGGIYNEIGETYKEFNSIFASLRTQTIVKHERLELNVYRTTYEDGTEIIVNYNNYDVVADGKTVGTNNYIVVTE